MRRTFVPAFRRRGPVFGEPLWRAGGRIVLASGSLNGMLNRSVQDDGALLESYPRGLRLIKLYPIVG